MDITPIYELKTRLRAAMIAGTNLISEDFRLKKAAESFAPLAASSPVFAKINAMTQKLLEEKSPECLLDTITLVDSVLTTLGTTEVKGELESLPDNGISSVNVTAPYSQLSTVIDSLTLPGSGQFNRIVEMRENTPEIFRDYRVMPALVKGLGASYSELANMVEDIIFDIGKPMLPLLKKDFNPMGQKESVRRVTLIDRLGGAGENAFYIEQLENSEKDVRKALIYALRHDERNIDKLIELAKTEKGKPKTAALAALISFDDEKAADFFNEYAKKKPAEVISLLENASSKWSSELAARLINEALVDDQGNKITLSQSADVDNVKLKIKTSFWELNSAMWGKWGADIETLYSEFYRKERMISMDARLGETILETNNESLKKLAVELNGNSKLKDCYIYSETLVRLMNGNIDVKWFEEHAKKAVPDKRYAAIGHITDPFWRAIADPFIKAVNDIRLMDGEYMLCQGNYDDVLGKRVCEKPRPIARETVYALTDVLIKYPSFQCDTIMRNWADKSDPEYCKKLAEMFTDHAVNGERELARTLMFVKDTGVVNVKGAAVRYCKNHPKMNGVDLRGLFNYLQGDPDYKLAEARELYDLLRKGKIKWDPVPGDLDSFIDWVETYKFRP